MRERGRLRRVVRNKNVGLGSGIGIETRME